MYHLCQAADCYYPSGMNEAVQQPGLDIERIAEFFLNVVVCDVNQGLLKDFDQKVGASNSGRTLAVECDITSDKALDDLFAKIEAKFGPLDSVVNCAGVIDRINAAGDIEREVWDRVIAINLVHSAKTGQPHLLSKMHWLKFFPIADRAYDDHAASCQCFSES